MNNITKQPFYTAYQRRDTEPAPAGEKEEPVYQMQINARGHKELVKTGKTNIYDIIQESLEQSKIENIIRRATEGDAYALQAMNGQYIDVSEMPKTLAEAQQFVIKAKGEFDQLPINIRRKFDMSAEKYIATYGTSEWIEAMEIVKNTQKKDPTPIMINNKKSEQNIQNAQKGENKE